MITRWTPAIFSSLSWQILIYSKKRKCRLKKYARCANYGKFSLHLQHIVVLIFWKKKLPVAVNLLSLVAYGVTL